jgi:O-antigen/teichoic acid export membrane protein
MDVLEKKRTIKNIGYLTLSKVLVYLLSIVTITLIPRYLGVVGYGQLNFVLSFIGIFAIFGDLGINTLIFRDVSKNPSLKDKYFNNLFLPKLLLLFIVSLLMILVSFFLDKPLIVKQMIFFGLFFVVFHFGANTISRTLSSLQLFKYQAYQELLSKLLYTVLALLVIYFNQGLLGIFLSQVIAFFIVFVYLFIVVRKYINLKLKLNTSFFIKKLKYSWPFALSIIFTTIFFNFDRIFISLIKDDFQLGLYAVGVTFVGFLITIISVFGVILFNLLSKYSFKKESLSIFNKFLKIYLIIGFPIFFGGLLLSKEIITLIFGVNYVLGSTSFATLLFFFLVLSINSIFSQYMFSHNLQKYMLKVRGIATGINIVLNLLFIPFFGIVGAAVTTVISEIIVFIFNYKKIKTKLNFTFFNPFYKVLLSSIVMLFFIYIFKYIYKIRLFYNSFDVLFIIGVCGLIYLINLYILKVISLEEIKDILSFTKK